MFSTVGKIKDLKGKRVLLRVDFDVPVIDGVITDKFRVDRQKPMIDYLLDRGALVVMVAHISETDSFDKTR